MTTQHSVSTISGLEGRVAIITGAGQGLGRAFAKAFAGEGAKVVIAEFNEETGPRVAEEIRSAGGEAIFVKTDVGDYASCEAMAAATLEAFGRIDILINNAGIFSTLEMRPLEEIPIAEWERVLHVNVTGAYYCSRAVVPVMKKAGWGRIVNMASGAVTLGRPNYLHYITSKSALAGMARSMARELGPYGITVNAMLPGATFTEIERKTVSPEQKQKIVAMQCVPRAEGPEDLVGAMLFLCSPHSEFMTGQQVNVDGGATHL
jgi:NAD(P)-dependent dehydrogenase (short-subunit alcohol dehydrogenase family)